MLKLDKVVVKKIQTHSFRIYLNLRNTKYKQQMQQIQFAHKKHTREIARDLLTSWNLFT